MKANGIHLLWTTNLSRKQEFHSTFSTFTILDKMVSFHYSYNNWFLYFECQVGHGRTTPLSSNLCLYGGIDLFTTNLLEGLLVPNISSLCTTILTYTGLY
jgi:hypothetical protein